MSETPAYVKVMKLLRDLGAAGVVPYRLSLHPSLFAELKASIESQPFFRRDVVSPDGKRIGLIHRALGLWRELEIDAADVGPDFGDGPLAALPWTEEPRLYTAAERVAEDILRRHGEAP